MEFDYVNLSDPESMETLILMFLMHQFLDYLISKIKTGKDVYVVIPPKYDLEIYVFNLESILLDRQMPSNSIHYIRYENMINELPTFIDNVVLDPRCVTRQLSVQQNYLTEIKRILNNAGI